MYEIEWGSFEHAGVTLLAPWLSIEIISNGFHVCQLFLTDVKVLAQIRGDLNRILHPKKGFKPYEKLQGIMFLDKEFKLGEEQTNTLKKKRYVIEKKYRGMIKDLCYTNASSSARLRQ